MLKTKKRIRREFGFWAKKILGKEDPLIASTRSLAAEWSRILGSAPMTAPSRDGGKKIVFLTANGLNSIALSVETLLAKSLTLRGHACVSVICDSGLPSCEFNAGGSGRLPAGRFGHGYSAPARAQMCRNCALSARTAMDAVGVPVHMFAEYSAGHDAEALRRVAETLPLAEIKDHVYRGVRAGDHAFSSTLRITLRGVIDLDDRDEAFIYRRQFLSAMTMIDRMYALIDALKPDKVIGVHGVYLTHGVMADVCALRGVDAVIYGVPYRKGTLWLSHKETYHRTLVTDPNDLWSNLVLTPAMDKTLDEYLASKTAGGRDNVNYHPNPITERETVSSALGLDPGKPVVSMFTNVIWDAQIYYQFNAFENIFDWIYSSIEWFAGRPDLQLVIRIHPAETKGGFTTSQPMAPEIAKRFPKLPPNIFVIPSESDISSYTVAEMSRAAIIYGTKMGLEIALRGIPVIVAGETFNRRKGFTYDVETRQQYFELLGKVLELPANSPEMIANVRKFSYYLFFKKMIDMPLLAKNLHGAYRAEGERFYNFDTPAALLPGKDRGIDAICDGIIHRRPFFVSA